MNLAWAARISGDGGQEGRHLAKKGNWIRSEARDWGWNLSSGTVALPAAQVAGVLANDTGNVSLFEPYLRDDAPPTGGLALATSMSEDLDERIGWIQGDVTLTVEGTDVDEVRFFWEDGTTDNLHAVASRRNRNEPYVRPTAEQPSDTALTVRKAGGCAGQF